MELPRAPVTPGGPRAFTPSMDSIGPAPTGPLPEALDLCDDDIEQLLQGIASAHGLTVDVDYRLGYPVTNNDPGEYDAAVEVVHDLFGADRFTEMPAPELGSEDMAFVFEQVPGAYLFISACPDDDYAAAPDNHSPRAVFDDSVLPDCAAWLAEVAMRRLARS